MMSEEIIEALRERSEGLHPYLNSKELDEIGHYISDISKGLYAQEEAKQFLEVVPKGKFDGDRRHYYDELRKRELETTKENEQ